MQTLHEQSKAQADIFQWKKAVESTADIFSEVVKE